MIKISDYPNQEEFISQKQFETIFNKMMLQVKNGELMKGTIQTWKSQNSKQLMFIKNSKDDTLELQNAVYNELLSVEIK
jgi:hypothetical protein